LTKRAGSWSTIHGGAQRKQDAVVVELARQILRHHVLLHRRTAMKPQSTLLQVGHELLFRGRQLIRVRAEVEVAQKLAIHRHT
jgi:hypothetical protein